MELKQLDTIELVSMQVSLQREGQIINNNLQAISQEILKRIEEHNKIKEEK